MIKIIKNILKSILSNKYFVIYIINNINIYKLKLEKQKTKLTKTLKIFPKEIIGSGQ